MPTLQHYYSKILSKVCVNIMLCISTLGFSYIAEPPKETWSVYLKTTLILV